MRLAIILGALAAILGALWAIDHRAYRRGADEVRAEWQAQTDIAADKAREIEARNATTSERIGGEAKAAEVEIRWRTKTLIEKVPYYVPTDPVGWSLPVGFVRLHRASTSGLPVEPGPASLPDDAPSGVGLATLAEVDIGNAGACRAELDRFARLQAWVSETR